MRSLHFFVLWLAILVDVAPAAQFFVAPGGSDASPGSSASPWATLQHAANVVGPGDRVTARPGNYTGFNFTTSGTAISPIEFFAEPGVLINQRNAVTPDGINLESASYVTIDGFSVKNMPRAGIRAAALPAAGMNHVTIRNVRAADNAYWGVFTGFVDDLLIESNETSGSIVEHGIYVSNSGDRPVIRNNLVWGNRGNGIHMNGDVSQGGDGVISNALVSGNVIHDNGLGGGSGINMDGVRNSRLENNLLYKNHASGISIYQGDGGAPSTGNVVVNNTVHQPSDGRWALNIQDAATNNTILNNILVSDHAFRGAIDVSADSLSGLVSDYNVVAPRFTTNGGTSILNLAQWQTLTGQDLHSIASTAAALFVNPAAGDDRLRPAVAAIDLGTSLQAPAFDLAGAPRPFGLRVDAGAYEFGAAPLSADFNFSGAVDAADLGPWRARFGLIGPQGDATGDFQTDGNDLLAWQRQLGGFSGALSAIVPEPPTSAAFWWIVGSLARGIGHRRR